jgi:DNA-binding GntR family transcriptional regulator
LSPFWRGDIGDGSLPPETQVPPEEGLIDPFKVSRTTVRKAIKNLVERGLVEVGSCRAAGLSDDEA